MQKQTKMQIGFSGRPDQQHKKETTTKGRASGQKETEQHGKEELCWTKDNGQMTKDKWRRTNDKWHWTKEKGQMENEQHEKVSVKPRRGISGGSDCKDSGSCLKSRFSWIYYFRISPVVLQCVFCQFSGLSEAEGRWYANSMQLCPFLWMQRNLFLHRFEIHSNHLAEHPIWHLPTGFGMSWTGLRISFDDISLC